MRSAVNTRVLYTLLSALIIIMGSIVAIRFAEGYRLSFSSQKGVMQGTGLLSANSFPSGAEIYINDKLVGASDDTINLDPGQYQIEIRKDGYTPWKKQLKIERELVAQTNAQLFRIAPGLTALTSAGAQNISPSPDGDKLLFYTASASAQEKNGLYLADLSNSILSLNREPRQLCADTPGIDLSKASFIWSPDNTQVMVTTPNHDFLVDINQKCNLATATDVAFRKRQILGEWESELYLRERQYLSRFPVELMNIATQSAQNIYLSPDKNKLMYTATASAKLPDNIAPTLPASDSQPEQRTLQPGSTYIYDREEDKNFLISTPKMPTTSTAAQKVLLASDLSNKDPMSYTASPSSFERLQASASAETAGKFASFYSSLYSTGVQWFPDSKHVLFADQDKIYILEYDNTNQTAVYAGPFGNHFVYPWPDGSQLVILTSLNANAPMNLYAVELK